MALTNSNGVATTDASRCSVSETRSRAGGAAIPASTVRSVTKNLRFAYGSVEANTVATGGDSSNYFTRVG